MRFSSGLERNESLTSVYSQQQEETGDKRKRQGEENNDDTEEDGDGHPEKAAKRTQSTVRAEVSEQKETEDE